jgi:ubiquinone/menaquinone biosynthesis C-methylase UbiE
MSSLPARLVACGFRQLYTRLAFTYDLVAAGVSFGEWEAWGRCAIPFLRGRRVLDLAHGPGHLHLELRRLGWTAAGVDLSPQMGAMARRRLRRAGYDPRLARADAGRLPFQDGAFDTVVSTFPAGFILAPRTLSEVRRVLAPGGALIVVPSVEIAGRGIAEHFVRGLYRLTGQGGRRRIDVEVDVDVNVHVDVHVRRIFAESGFAFTPHAVATRRARVSVWECVPSYSAGSSARSVS